MNEEGVEFPADIISVIYSFCEDVTICRASFVCVDWYNAQVEDYDHVWRTKTIQRWAFASDKPRDLEWRQYYFKKAARATKWERGKPADFKMMAMRGHKNYITCTLLCDPLVFSGSADGTVKVWKRQENEKYLEMASFPHDAKVNCLQYYDSRVVYSGDDNGNISCWSVDSAKLVHSVQHSATAPAAVTQIQVEEDEEKIISAASDGTIVVWDEHLATREVELSHAAHGGQRNPITYLGCAWDKKQQLVSVSPTDVFIWDTRNAGNKMLHRHSPPSGQITSAEWSCQTDVLAYGTTDGNLHVLNTKTGNLAHTWNVGQVITVVKIRGEKVVCGTNTGLCHLYKYKPATANAVHYTLQGHTAQINDIALDGDRVVSGSIDGCCMVHSAEDGTKFFALLGGSMQPRDNDPPHPQKPWISGVKMDDVQVLATRNSMMRAYHFDLPKN